MQQYIPLQSHSVRSKLFYILYYNYIKNIIEMSLIDCQILNQFLQQAQGIIQNQKTCLQMAKSLKITRIGSFEDLKKIAKHINIRFQLNYQQDQKKAQYIQECKRKWVFGEYKLFSNILVLNAAYNSISIQEMKKQDFTFISSIFKEKEIEFIRYQIAFIANSRKIIRTGLWTHEQSHFLRAIVAQEKDQLSWRKIALLLYQKSQRIYFRTFSQCRQQWINHLNPQLKKTKWSLQQDTLLHSLIQMHGLKWSVISKSMAGRSQHMVKNRYNSLKRYKLVRQKTIIQQKTNCSSEIQIVAPSNKSYSISESDLQNIFIQKRQLSSKPQNCFENLGFEDFLYLSFGLCQ